MSSLSILFLLTLPGTPVPSEVLNDLDAHPWRPAPAAPVVARPVFATPVAAESTTRIGSQGAPGAFATPTPKPQTREPTPSGSWQLQLGALSSPDAANAEKKRIEKILGSGTIELFADGGVNKLRYGKFGSKDEAESARATLKSRGIDGFAAFRP